jgi:YD repeat-containing protein
MAVSIEGGEDLYYPTPLGGIVKTLYDENDRPTELQVYVAGGKLAERLVRAYDSAGRPMETKVVLEDISAIFPADTAKELLNQPGAAEELQRQLLELLGPQREFGKVTYTYDSEGRVTEKHNNFGPGEIVTKSVYNHQGDPIEERTTTSGNPLDAANASAAPDAMGAESGLVYVYKYDGYGNWTEQAMQSKSHPDGVLQDAGICRRTITYY